MLRRLVVVLWFVPFCLNCVKFNQTFNPEVIFSCVQGFFLVITFLVVRFLLVEALLYFSSPWALYSECSCLFGALQRNIWLCLVVFVEFW